MKSAKVGRHSQLNSWPELVALENCQTVEAAYAPGSSPDQHNNSTSYSSTVVHCVQSLYINRYVYSNKSVLS